LRKRVEYQLIHGFDNRFEGDIEGFVNGSKAMASGGTQAVHIIIPVEIDINGNKALAQSTGNIQIRFQYDGNDYDCTSYTTFVSRLEKVDEEWKILTLDCIYDRDTLTAPIPVEKPVRLPVDQFVCRRSYKCIGWVLSLRGYNINQNLPGKDDPASVIHFMAENVAWLQS
jgi:hypothetical protein